VAQPLAGSPAHFSVSHSGAVDWNPTLNTPILVIDLLALASVGYYMGRRKALALVDHPRQLRSLAAYHGAWVLIWGAIPSLMLIGIWSSAQPTVVDHLVSAELPASVLALGPQRLGLFLNDAKNLASGNIVSGEIDGVLRGAASRYNHLGEVGRWARNLLATLLSFLGMVFAWRSISVSFAAMRRVEAVGRFFLMAGSTVAVLTTIGIVLSLLFEAIRFFRLVPLTDFLFGLEWSPQTALRADQVGSSGAFGAVPLFAGTLLITFIAMAVAVPIGLLSAIYMSEYASPRVRTIAKPLLEILAGIPTVVYGFFAALTVAPWLRGLAASLGLGMSSESALAAGAVMGVMIIPFISSLSDDVIMAVPTGLREASRGLGASRSETIRKVIVPAALPGIVGGLLLAVSRAVGETMIVVMAAGLAANLTANPLHTVTTVTVQIVTLLIGDQEFDSAKTLAAFALGLVLFVVTFVLNVIALGVVRRYRNQYD